MQSKTMKRLAANCIASTILVASFVTPSFADLRIRRRVSLKDTSYETITYLKGARQRNETWEHSRRPGKSFEVAFVEQCDLNRLIWIDLMNKRFAIHPGGVSVSAAMAFNEQQLPNYSHKKYQRAYEEARKRGLLTATTTVVDTGERREMFGFTARRLKTTTVWEATPKICDGPGMIATTDGWYTDLFYGIDCSADLSGSITQTHVSGGGRCFSEYAIKRRYWLERKRIGPASLGYPLLETRTSYDDKGEAEVVTEEVVELSTAALDASLFDAPAGFTEVELQTDNRSFFGRLFSFLGK